MLNRYHGGWKHLLGKLGNSRFSQYLAWLTVFCWAILFISAISMGPDEFNNFFSDNKITGYAIFIIAVWPIAMIGIYFSVTPFFLYYYSIVNSIEMAVNNTFDP